VQHSGRLAYGCGIVPHNRSKRLYGQNGRSRCGQGQRCDHIRVERNHAQFGQVLAASPELSVLAELGFQKPLGFNRRAAETQSVPSEHRQTEPGRPETQSRAIADRVNGPVEDAVRQKPEHNRAGDQHGDQEDLQQIVAEDATAEALFGHWQRLTGQRRGGRGIADILHGQRIPRRTTSFLHSDLTVIRWTTGDLGCPAARLFGHRACKLRRRQSRFT